MPHNLSTKWEILDEGNKLTLRATTVNGLPCYVDVSFPKGEQKIHICEVIQKMKALFEDAYAEGYDQGVNDSCTR